MSNLLFTEVSVEEQEIVTGGVDAGSGSLATYLAKITNTNAAAAGIKGAAAGSTSSVDVASLGINFSFITGL